MRLSDLASHVLNLFPILKVCPPLYLSDAITHILTYYNPQARSSFTKDQVNSVQHSAKSSVFSWRDIYVCAYIRICTYIF